MADGAGDADHRGRAASRLAWLIAPETPERFFADVWERRHLVVRGTEADRFGDLLSLDEVDRVLTGSVLRVEDVQLTNAGREVKPGQYSHPSGVIDVARVYQELADGSTVILPQLHFRLPRLAALCRGLEGELGARFQTNVYLTPGGAQGFKRHFDNHDVFVLQVAGCKHWRLYDTPVALPLRGQEFRPEAVAAAEQTGAFTLGPGDVAYLPRGLMHEAESDDAMSLHITVGALARTWHDLLVEALSDVTLRDVAFRRSLPPGFVKAGFDRANARADFADLLARLARQADFDTALDRFAEELVSTRNPLLPGQLAQVAGLSQLDDTSLVSPRPNLIYRLEKTAEGLAIHCYGTVVTVPIQAAPAATAALQADALAIGDLPGPLDAEGRLVLVRRLVREGLVVVH